MKLDLTLGFHQTLQETLSLKMELKSLLELSQTLRHGPHDVPAIKRGLEGMICADEILKRRRAVGILIGGLSEAIWNQQRNPDELSAHKDVDVMVLDPSFRLKEPFEGGIDWWLPKSQELIIEGAGSRIEKSQTTWWQNGNGVILSFGAETNEPLPPGLSILDICMVTSMRITEVLANVSTNIRANMAEEVIDSFEGRISAKMGTRLPKFIREIFADQVAPKDSVTFTEKDLNTQRAIKRDPQELRQLEAEQKRKARKEAKAERIFQKVWQLQAEQEKKAREEAKAEEAERKKRLKGNTERNLQWRTPKIAAFWEEHAGLKKELEDAVAMYPSLSGPVQDFLFGCATNLQPLFSSFYKVPGRNVLNPTLGNNTTNFEENRNNLLSIGYAIKRMQLCLVRGLIYRSERYSSDLYRTSEESHVLTPAEKEYLSKFLEFLLELLVRLLPERDIKTFTDSLYRSLSGSCAFRSEFASARDFTDSLRLALNEACEKLGAEENMSAIEIWNILHLKVYAFNKQRVSNPLDSVLQKYQIEEEGEDNLPLYMRISKSPTSPSDT